MDSLETFFTSPPVSVFEPNAVSTNPELDAFVSELLKEHFILKESETLQEQQELAFGALEDIPINPHARIKPSHRLVRRTNNDDLPQFAGILDSPWKLEEIEEEPDSPEEPPTLYTSPSLLPGAPLITTEKDEVTTEATASRETRVAKAARKARAQRLSTQPAHKRRKCRQWTEEEDAILRKIGDAAYSRKKTPTERVAKGTWTEAAKQLEDRSGDSCRRRYELLRSNNE